MLLFEHAIRRLFKAVNSSVGNLPPMPGLFPDRQGECALTGAAGLLGTPERDRL
jgi:hypothetical protein